MPPLVRRKQRASFTAREKLAVLNAAGKPPDVAKVLGEFFPDLSPAAYVSRRKLLESWLRNRAKIEEQCKEKNGGDKRKARPKGVGTVLPLEAEQELVVLVNDLRKEGVPISNLILELESRDIAKAYSIDNFSASWSWSTAFKARHKLSMRARTRQGQKTPEDLDKIAATFASTVKRTMQELGVTKVYNTDQTAAFFEFLPTRTINKKGPKTVWVKCAGKDNERATVMLLGDSEGIKYRPFVVFKTEPSKLPNVFEENMKRRNGFGRRIWDDVGPAIRNYSLEIYGNRAGWWNGYLSLQFLKYHFGARVDMSQPILLLWDDFSGHWTKEVVSYASSINVVLLKVPPSATSVSQPADVAWNRPFKARLRACWIASLRKQLRARVYGAPFSMKAPDRIVMSKWIREAWDGLTSETIAAGYTKCYGQLVSESDVVAADLISRLDRQCVLDREVGEVESDDDMDA